MGFCQQYRGLMTKNSKLKRRKCCSTCCEFMLPILVVFILVGIRAAIPVQDKDPDLHLSDAEVLFPTTGYAANAATYTPSDPLDVIGASSINMLAYKILRRGHVLAIAPNRAPFCSSDPDSFSSRFAAYLDDVATTYGISQKTDTRSDTCSGSWYLRGFGDQGSVEGYATSGNYPSEGFLEAGITFSEFDNGTLSYTILQNQTAGGGSQAFQQQIPTSYVPQVNKLYIGQVLDYFDRLYYGGFLALQNYVDSWAVGNLSGNMTAAQLNNGVGLFPFPTPKYRADGFAGIVGGLLPFLFVLAFIFPVNRLVKVLVEEKELRIKEGLRMMGMTDMAHFTSWWTTYLIMFTCSSILITIITKSLGVFTYSSGVILFFYFFIFMQCIFAFGWFTAAIFSRATVAATVSSVLFLGLFFAGFGLNESSTRGTKTLACLSAPVCFGLGAQNIAYFESAQQGVTSANTGEYYDEFSMGTCLGMMTFDYFLYLILAVYVGKVFPSEWGVAEKPWFFLLPSYWCSTREVREVEQREFDERYERVESKDLRVGVSVQNLYKQFDTQTEDEAAVKRINLDMYEGQILSLLGHNGAGKTTTINMLTGMLPPTSGDALVQGLSINSEMGLIRRDLGACPQHNILYDLLTVEEHLVLYSKIKGIPAAEIPESVQRAITEVGLTEKVNTFSKALSGGMKRKLSVAIALVGGSRTVFLDEPTSGMDPYSRRSTWEMLKQAKPGRVLILTTHFMDEADQLGDRIAIMHRGEIKCCGTSLFLKSKYGVGYTLTVDKKEGANSAPIVAHVRKSVNKCNVLSDVAGEVSFQLPLGESSKFPDMFDALDAKKGQWGINSYGVSVTTLEEVFLKVGQESDVASASPELKKKLSTKMSTSDTKNEEIDEAPYEAEDDPTVVQLQDTKQDGSLRDTLLPKRGRPSLATHFKALLLKRWHNAKRDPKVWLWQILYPTVILLLGVGLARLGASFQGKYVPISVSQYNQPNYVPYNEPAGGFLDTVYDANTARLVEADRPTDETPLRDQDCSFTSDPVATATNMSSYLLCTWKQYEQSKYGALLSNVNPANSPNDNFYYNVKQSVFFNTTGTYSVAAYLNLLNQARARNASAASSNIQINVGVKPWPLTAQQQSLNNSIVSLVAAIGFSFIPAAIVAFVVMERQTGSKHLQIVSGVNTVMYWVANFVWDLANFLPPCLLSLVIFKAFAIDTLTGDAAGVVLLAALLYGCAIISFTYCASFFFKNPSSAQSIMLMVYIFTGAILLIASIIMSAIQSTKHVNEQLRYVYRLVPTYSFGEIIVNLMTRDTVLIWGAEQSVTSYKLVGKPFIYLACESVVYFCILLLIEYVLATPSLYIALCRIGAVEDEPEEEDQDIVAERERLHAPGCTDLMKVKGLRKVYPGRIGVSAPKVAVRNLWFGIPEGQCFGFLGINGAGKSSTLKMLTGDILPTAGTAELAGYDVLEDQMSLRKLVGYCPQFDALLPKMTARETLTMFARFKGYPEDSLAEYVEKLCEQLSLNINNWLDKPCGGYSGGNKRKLSVGIALVGNPSIVFLDEPSTGMDPGSRRFMWDLISSTMAHRSVILTTHSMEECEALCARVGIMVGGRLRCLGSSQHLKSRYGSGYQLEVKVAADKTQAFQKWVSGEFKNTELLEDQGQNMKFRIQSGGRSLGGIFRVIETNRGTLGVIEYSVSETTLEQIFLQFAKQQNEETGDVAGLTDIGVERKSGAVPERE